MAGRDADVLHWWLAARPDEWLDGVTVVSIDPFQAYRNDLKSSLDTVVADRSTSESGTGRWTRYAAGPSRNGPATEAAGAIRSATSARSSSSA